MKNKGFSFVELIAAVAILGIVSLPIASSFVLAARIETKAAILSKLNDAADDVMLLVTETEHMEEYGATLETLEQTENCGCTSFDIYHVLNCVYSNYLSSVQRGEGENANSYSVTYNGYPMLLQITPVEDFYRIDLTIEHEANGSTYHITRKGVLSYAAS